MRVAMLFPHLPHALQTMEQVAAPQQLAKQDVAVPKLGTASSGRERRAPILSKMRHALDASDRRLRDDGDSFVGSVVGREKG